MEGVAYEQFLNLERDHWWFIGRRRSYFRILEHRLARKQGLAILDVGCGVGGMLPELARLGTPVGIDADEGSIAICKRRGFTDCKVASGTTLPIVSGTQDLVTLFDTIEHVDDDVGALREAHRALKPGGTVFISVPAYQFLYSNNDKVAHHKRRYTKGGLKRRVREAGFDVVHATYVNVVLFPLILPAVLLLKLKEALFPKPDDTRTNLSHTPAPIVNRTLAAIFGGEGHVLKSISAPFGHSLVLVGRKP